MMQVAVPVAAAVLFSLGPGECMGRHIERQEILITPEGKAKRCSPTLRGLSINVTELIARRQVGLKQTNIVSTGHIDPQEFYAGRKIEAITSKSAISNPTIMQADRHRFDQTGIEPGLQLKTAFAGLDDTQYAPPDCQMASGPDHIMVVVNGSWAVFDKAGRQLLRRNFADLFESLAENASIYKPRVVYDHFRGGWLMATCAVSHEQAQTRKQAWFFLAASHGPDPLGDWWVWAIDTRSDDSQPNLNPDALGLAVDATSVYLTANMFAGRGQFAYARLRVLSKSDLQVGGMLHSWDFWHLKNFDGTPSFGIQPALNMRAPEGQFMVNATADGQSLTLWKVAQRARQAPTLTRKSVPTTHYSLAPNVRQPKIEREIETGDTRLCQVVYRHGQLWAAHSIAVNWGDGQNFAGIHWFQINTKAGFVTQQGIFGAPGYHYFCPAVMVDQTGNMVMVFNRVSESDPLAICYAGKFANDEPNRLRDSVELLQSSMAGASEWSSSSAAAIDPEEGTLWIMGQYVATASDWATWIGAVNSVEGSGIEGSGIGGSGTETPDVPESTNQPRQ